MVDWGVFLVKRYPHKLGKIVEIQQSKSQKQDKGGFLVWKSQQFVLIPICWNVKKKPTFWDKPWPKSVKKLLLGAKMGPSMSISLIQPLKQVSVEAFWGQQIWLTISGGRKFLISDERYAWMETRINSPALNYPVRITRYNSNNSFIFSFLSNGHPKS